MVRNRNISRPHAQLQGGLGGLPVQLSWSASFPCDRVGLEGQIAAMGGSAGTYPLDRHPSFPKELFARPCGVEAFT